MGLKHRKYYPTPRKPRRPPIPAPRVIADKRATRIAKAVKQDMAIIEGREKLDLIVEHQLADACLYMHPWMAQ